MALQIKPSQNISQMSAKYEYSVTTFDLNEGLWETIDNLITNKTYIFFIEATEAAKINISIIINNTGIENDEYDEYELPIILNNGTIIHPYPKKDTIPNYIDINLYEYEKKNNSYNTYFQKNAKRLNKERDIYFMTRNYIKVNSSNTTYLAFSFKPNFNINHMRVNINISGGLFDLLNNTSKNMFNLRSDNDYYFIIEAHQFNFIRLALTMNNYMNLTTNPFSYIYYYQLEDRKNYYYYKKYEESISPIINEKQIIISKNVSGVSTNYIYFRIRPSYYIDKTTIKVDVTDCLINMDNYKYFKGIYYLKSNYTYYIKMNAWSNHKTKLNLKFYNMSKMPFSFIKIHESFYAYSMSQWKKNTTKQIKFKEKNNILEITIEKKNTLNAHIFLFIEITPDYDINYMVAEAQITENFKIDDIGSIIIIIIEIIIFSLMILYIINHFKKCIKCLSKSKDISLSNLDLNNQNEIMSQD